MVPAKLTVIKNSVKIFFNIFYFIIRKTKFPVKRNIWITDTYESNDFLYSKLSQIQYTKQAMMIRHN